jgi:hypothetical protein
MALVASGPGYRWLPAVSRLTRGARCRVVALGAVLALGCSSGAHPPSARQGSAGEEPSAGSGHDATSAGNAAEGGGAAAGTGAGGEAGASQDRGAIAIGPEGGVISDASGTLTLSIPAGALQTVELISIRPFEDAPAGALGSAFEILPTGLHFDLPATLVYAYAGAAIGDASESELSLGLATDSAWAELSSTVDTGEKSVTAALAHLSVYGLIVRSALTAPAGPPGGGCQLNTETSQLPGNQMAFEYTYGADGNVSQIESFNLGYHTPVITWTIGGTTVTALLASGNSETTVYNQQISDGYPTYAQVFFQEGGISHESESFSFLIDAQDRPHSVERRNPFAATSSYDLDIYYDANDDVSQLAYDRFTMPNTYSVVQALGYDDKPNPFVGIHHWYFMMHRAWDNYDPSTVLIALSAHNLLGFELADGEKSEMVYTYGPHGLPTRVVRTNSRPGTASSTWEESYSYDCP